MRDKAAWIQEYSTAATWELEGIIMALNMLGGFLNSEEDDIRLAAARAVFNQRKRGK